MSARHGLIREARPRTAVPVDPSTLNRIYSAPTTIQLPIASSIARSPAEQRLVDIAKRASDYLAYAVLIFVPAFFAGEFIRFAIAQWWR